MRPTTRPLVLLSLGLALLTLLGCNPLRAPATPSMATVTVQSAPVAVGGTPSPTAASPDPSPTAAIEPSPTAESAAPASATTFRIVPADSTAQFALGETLRGEAKRVVGTTHDVTGEIVVDFNDPAATQLSEIAVNARTLVTDDSNRNRALANFILQSGEFEFITFKPTAITGLSGPVAVGQPVSFEMVGDLTIRDQSRPATFQVTVTPTSATRLEGSATSTINRGDFGLVIPSVPFVADVEEQVELRLDFVAVP